MNKTMTKKSDGDISKKKWLTLGVVAMVLLLIPRRSSRKDMTVNQISSEDLKDNLKDKTGK